MEETIKRLQIALGVLLVALLVVFITGTALILSSKPEPQVAVNPPPKKDGGDQAAPALDAEAQRGEAIFKNNNCATCHVVSDEVVVGPGLKGVTQRAPSREWLHKWIHNSSAVIASGDQYGTQLFNKYNKLQMPSYPDLSDEDIDAILKYIEVAGG